jgi:hypothetical protein
VEHPDEGDEEGKAPEVRVRKALQGAGDSTRVVRRGRGRRGAPDARTAVRESAQIARLVLLLGRLPIDRSRGRVR